MSASIAAGDRVVGLEGCFNFRDLGGYATSDGRVVRWRRLFRSDGLHRLTDRDLHRLGQLGIRTVVDLRTAGEVNERGRVALPAHRVDYFHLPMFDVLPDRSTYPAWVDATYVADRYADMLATGGESVTETLAILTDLARYPAVFHCAAGKDRTGILAAIVLGLLGVSDHDIVNDYAMSGQAMAHMLEWLRSAHPERADELESNASAIMAAEPETMSLFLARFRADHGSFEEYADHLGLASAVEHLRAALLE